jgi:hypothetical protein
MSQDFNAPRITDEMLAYNESNPDAVPIGIGRGAPEYTGSPPPRVENSAADYNVPVSSFQKYVYGPLTDVAKGAAESMLVGLPQGAAVLDEARARATNYLAGKDLVNERPVTEHPLYRFGQWAGDKIEGALPQDPRLADTTLSNVSRGIGQVGAMAMTAPMAGAGAASVINAAAQGGLMQSADMYKRAKEENAGEEQAIASGMVGTLIGASDVIPVYKALTIAKKATNGLSTKVIGRTIEVLSKAGEVGIENALQEAGQSAAEDMTAAKVYGSMRPMFSDVGKSAEVGGITGSAIGAIASMLNIRMRAIRDQHAILTPEYARYTIDTNRDLVDKMNSKRTVPKENFGELGNALDRTGRVKFRTLVNNELAKIDIERKKIGTDVAPTSNVPSEFLTPRPVSSDVIPETTTGLHVVPETGTETVSADIQKTLKPKIRLTNKGKTVSMSEAELQDAAYAAKPESLRPLQLTNKGKMAEQPLSNHAVIDEMRHVWGPVEHGWLRNRENVGEHNPNSGVSRLSKQHLGDIRVAAHERIGHGLDFKHGIIDAARKAGVLDEIMPLDYTREPNEEPNPREALAEYMATWVTERGSKYDVSKQAPRFTDWFENQWMKDPNHAEDAAALDRVRDMTEVVRSQSPGTTARANIGPTNKPIESPYRTDMERVIDKAKNTAIGFYETFFNKDLSLALYDRAYKKQLANRGKAPPRGGTTSSELSMALSNSAIHFANDAFENGVMRLGGVMERMGPGANQIFQTEANKNDPNLIRGDEKEEFGQFAVARHAIECLTKDQPKRWTFVGKKINPGMNMEAAEEIYNDVKADPTKFARFEQGAIKLKAMNDAQIDLLVDTGRFSAEIGEFIKNYWDTYVPLLRAKGKDSLGLAYHRTGSDEPIIDPVNSTAMRMISSYIQATEQLVYRALYLESKAGNMGSQVEELPNGYKATTFTLEEIQKQLAEIGVIIPEDASREQLEATLTVFKPEFKPVKDENIHVIWVDGKQKMIRVNPRINKAITAMRYGAIDPSLQVLRAGVAAVRAGATGYNADWMVTNFLQDYPTSIIQRRRGLEGIAEASTRPAYVLGTLAMKLAEKIGKWPLKKAAGKLGIEKPTFENDPIYDQFTKIAGRFGSWTDVSYDAIDRSMRKNLGMKLTAGEKAWDVMRNATEYANDVTMLAEMPTRLAEFEDILAYRGYSREAIKGGKQVPFEVLVDAVNAAFDNPVNFKRMGYLGRKLNMISPFFNVMLQAPDKMIRSFRDNPAAMLTHFSTLGAMSAMYWLTVKDEDQYKQLSPENKYRYFYIFDHNGNVWFKFPRPYLFGVVTASVEAALNSMEPNEQNEMADWARAAWRSMGLNFDPVGKPIYDATVNRNAHTGRNIDNESDLRKEPWARYNKWTSVASKEIGKLVNVSPKRIDYVLDQMSGGGYKRLQDYGQWMINPHLTPKEFGNVPGAKGLYPWKEEDRDSREFSEEYDRVTKRYETERAEGKVGPDLAYKYLKARLFYDFIGKIFDVQTNYETVDQRRPYSKAIIGMSQMALGRNRGKRYTSLFDDDLPEDLKPVKSEFEQRIMRMMKFNMPSATKEQSKDDYMDAVDLAEQRMKLGMDLMEYMDRKGKSNAR